MHFPKLSSEEDDVHIKILRYALEHPGFTHSDLKEEFNLNNEQMVFVGQEIRDGGTFFTFVSSGQGKGYKFMLSFEGRSRLLEHDELKEARQNSRHAFIISVLAIVISFVGVILQFKQ